MFPDVWWCWAPFHGIFDHLSIFFSEILVKYLTLEDYVSGVLSRTWPLTYHRVDYAPKQEEYSAVQARHWNILWLIHLYSEILWTGSPSAFPPATFTQVPLPCILGQPLRSPGFWAVQEMPQLCVALPDTVLLFHQAGCRVPARALACPAVFPSWRKWGFTCYFLSHKSGLHYFSWSPMDKETNKWINQQRANPSRSECKPHHNNWHLNEALQFITCFHICNLFLSAKQSHGASLSSLFYRWGQLRLREVKWVTQDSHPLLFLRMGSCGWHSHTATWWKQPSFYNHSLVLGGKWMGSKREKGPRELETLASFNSQGRRRRPASSGHKCSSFCGMTGGLPQGTLTKIDFLGHTQCFISHHHSCPHPHWDSTS